MKLSDLCSKGSSSLRQKDLGNDGPYPVYGASGVVGTMAEYQNEKGYVGIVKDGAGIGRAFECSPKSSVLGTIQALLPKGDTNRDYLLHLVRSLDLAKSYSGSTIPHIYFKDYGKTLVKKTAIEEQEAIGGRFNKIDQLIQLQQNQLAKLDDFVKSRFNEMFENMKCNGTVAGVAETFNGDRGKNYPSANDKVSDGLPFVNAGNLKNGSVLFDDMDYITREKYETLSGGKICKGDILYCLRGSLGKSALVDFDEGTVASSLMIIRPNLEVITSRYLYEALNSPLVIRQMHAADNGSSQPNLSAKSVKAYHIPIPPLALQQEFAEFVAQVDKLRFGSVCPKRRIMFESR